MLAAVLVSAVQPSAAAAEIGEPDAPVDDSWPPHGLREVAGAFPKNQLLSGHGAEHLSAPVGDVLAEIARADDGAEPQIAFVLDLSFPGSFGWALEVALAAARDTAPAGTYALVTYGHDDGVASARIDVPLSKDIYSIVRAPERLSWKLNGTDVQATWTGLAKATELSWTLAGASPHVVILTDDRPNSAYSSEPSRVEPSLRQRVSSWASQRHATLHVIRLARERADQPRYEGQRAPGVQAKAIVGMFRDARYVKATAPAEMKRALEEVLARANADGPSDLVLLDDQRDGLDGPAGALSLAAPALQRFCAKSDHRLAVVRWGRGYKPAVALDFTSDGKKLSRTIAQTRRTSRGKGPDEFFEAVGTARHLTWSPAARKTIVIFNEGYLQGTAASRNVALDWTAAGDVAVTIIGP